MRTFSSVCYGSTISLGRRPGRTTHVQDPERKELVPPPNAPDLEERNTSFGFCGRSGVLQSSSLFVDVWVSFPPCTTTDRTLFHPSRCGHRGQTTARGAPSFTTPTKRTGLYEKGFSTTRAGFGRRGWETGYRRRLPTLHCRRSRGLPGAPLHGGSPRVSGTRGTTRVCPEVRSVDYTFRHVYRITVKLSNNTRGPVSFSSTVPTASPDEHFRVYDRPRGVHGKTLDYTNLVRRPNVVFFRK